jgi:hypothetical protein
MKLIFFLIAFSLVFLRVYFTGPWHDKSGKDDVTISISTSDYTERISYGGKIILSEDETAISSMSPGAFIKYRKNDRKLIAEANLQGEIHYKMSDDNKDLLKEAIQEMIAWGFDATGRMERVYSKGGKTALLSELTKMNSSAVINMYLSRLLADTTIEESDMEAIINKIGMLNADIDKVSFLNKLPDSLVRGPVLVQSYFNTVSRLNADIDKINVIDHWLNTKRGTASALPEILDIAARLNADVDKMRVMGNVLAVDSIPPTIFNKLLDITVHLNAGADRENMLTKIADKRNWGPESWIAIINATSQINDEFSRVNVLLSLSKKIPADDNIKTAFRNAAKSLHDDAAAGRLLKTIN